VHQQVQWTINSIHAIRDYGFLYGYGMIIGGELGQTSFIAASYAAGKIIGYVISWIPNPISNGFIFRGNAGYGFKIGSRIEILYQNPKVNGGTFINVASGKKSSIFRFDWDPRHGFHFHPPGHK